ncbi:PIN/TRAM domain-containing protein [Cohnella sp. JJ-181]|uniref:PIN/TRAM domain-containing protein n=1 Tax=Cohnella rhizoplanae TaxID=2974897 RepID=UPI0022FFC2AD|nr:PIN domain-containing protein [Cohnella sp. JJ-181]CAI6085209.1 putative PIN and TRAM-domain containing protein YacL [Cohnella sp. JJ-181]
MLMKRLIQAFGLLAGLAIGQGFASSAGSPGSRTSWMGGALGTAAYGGGIGAYSAWIGAVLGLLIATACAGALSELLRKGVDRLAGMPAAQLLAGLAGGGTGLILAMLLMPYLGAVPRVGALLSASAALAFAYAGTHIGLRKQEEVSGWGAERRKPEPAAEASPRYEEHKILDTSVIIDGRIADICKTGFIEGTLVIPEFVLEELQHIADSSDLLKRNRGRRGLDILNKIQKELDVKVLIYEDPGDETGEVDSRLVKLAKAMRGKVVTNDFNLNKVCELQGVSVLNINDLANAVKPVVLPGEEIVVQVIKDGKEHGQGVAYLDDGTMIVVEGGRDFIGTTMEVLVTSVLQTSAGRMIFAKPKLLERAL